MGAVQCAARRWGGGKAESRGGAPWVGLEFYRSCPVQLAKHSVAGLYLLLLPTARMRCSPFNAYRSLLTMPHVGRLMGVEGAPECLVSLIRRAPEHLATEVGREGVLGGPQLHSRAVLVCCSGCIRCARLVQTSKWHAGGCRNSMPGVC